MYLKDNAAAENVVYQTMFVIIYFLLDTIFCYYELLCENLHAFKFPLRNSLFYGIVARPFLY